MENILRRDGVFLDGIKKYCEQLEENGYLMTQERKKFLWEFAKANPDFVGWVKRNGGAYADKN